MENIDNMAKNSLELLAKENLSKPMQKKITYDIIAGAITLVFLISGLLYTYVFGNAYPVVPQIFYFVGFLIEGIPVIVSGLRGVFSRKMKNAMEILVSIAIVACVFDRQLIIALLIPLILNIVHLLEERSIMGGMDVIEGLKKMQQGNAVLLNGDEESVVNVKTLKVGDKIVVKPGMGIPVDGVVISGQTHIDQKSLTGEPEPFYASEGNMVYAGTVNIEGRIVVEVKKEYVDTSFSRIIELLEKSESLAVPESRLMDKFLSYYIPFILGLAIIVAIITKDMNKVIAILVVSCPCGYMLVNSAPVIASLSVATKRGILIKNSKFIEDLSDIDTVVFDKTGTITKGELAITEIVPFDNADSEQLVKLAGALAINSTHPVSSALSQYVKDNNIECKMECEIKEISGVGVEGKELGTDTVYRFGRLEWLEKSGCDVSDIQSSDHWGSISYLAKNETVLGYICFNDIVREDAKDSIDEIKALNIKNTSIMTGDRKLSAENIGKSVGIDGVFYELLPQDKLEKIRKLGEEGHSVLAVGDGINDALALREARVGISMGAMGSDLAIESSDIALMSNNLHNIPFVISLAKKTRKLVYQNMILSIVISVLMIGLASFGVITPLVGAILHNAGAFAVLINSSRLISLNKDFNK